MVKRGKEIGQKDKFVIYIYIYIYICSWQGIEGAFAFGPSPGRGAVLGLRQSHDRGPIDGPLSLVLVEAVGEVGIDMSLVICEEVTQSQLPPELGAYFRVSGLFSNATVGEISQY